MLMLMVKFISMVFMITLLLSVCLVVNILMFNVEVNDDLSLVINMLMVLLMLISMISSSVCFMVNMLRFNVNFNDEDDYVCLVVNMLMVNVIFNDDDIQCVFGGEYFNTNVNVNFIDDDI